ncbi:MAG TPA: acyl-CoA dehydrogenase family protein [Candidatus Saccharimonadales bacterium]|nr:acyl-CoA dehydrogenase family protein [Candidatus Saccharimonadales bacterium]
MTPAIQRALAASVERLETLDLGDAPDPGPARIVVETGLSALCVPVAAGGLGATTADAAEVLMALGAIDGSAALGFAMQVHVTGALRESRDVDPGLRERLWRAIVDEGALLNNAATEEGGGSPARGAIPGTTARRDDDGGYRLTGEKTWTTWLPFLTHAIVTARIDPTEAIGRFVVDLREPGVTRMPGFEALGMRGSASGRLLLDGARGEPTVRRPPDDMMGEADAEVRGATPAAWFGIAVAATYLGVGEGVRRRVARWALDRRPGDGSTAVAELPSVQVRLGRLDMALRAARIVVIEAARRWDGAGDATDVPLAKLVATSAAVDATDEALRIAGGPGFLTGPLERAFRDARAGLINPPLEDVALAGFARAVIERESAG